jgi:hypothetical protein
MNVNKCMVCIKCCNDLSGPILYMGLVLIDLYTLTDSILMKILSNK